ncbi:MAG: carboxypeptidase regulatory-like domain-containing protein [Acidobacteria bacterium]|nr:carboxypeptidase regulatory-like domain-containing protein [Acidobacteriota bacterium]MBW4045521.1 carboxypeptidase regulatory-like domain-containing protein [Acidobacteriota bacterium]
MHKVIRNGLALAGTVILSGAVAFAQNTNSGDIRGTVTDPTGAVIPGVTVTVKDIDKGVTHTYTTDGSGVYDTGSIVPDHYLITFTKDGFEKYVRGPITLQVAVVGVNAEMKVGASTQEVVVNTDVPLLQTETGSQSQTLESKQLLNLPQVGADWQNFITLLPGASSTVFNNRGGQAASINGNLPYNTVLGDGATTTLPMSENSNVMVLETVSEVKVDDSAFSAQYGIGGVTFNQISKGGSNTWHGSGYEFFQNNALNAAPYAFGQKSTVPVLRYNNFGGSVSGPIIKDKMFFYFNYDRTLDYGGASNGFITVPTAAMLNGDFSGQPTIYDPTTQHVDANGVLHRTSFAQEYGQGNKIPTNLMDPVAKAIQAYYPQANTAGTLVNGQVTNNYFYNVPSSNPYTKYFGRLDYNINANNHMIVSETNTDNPAEYLNQGICPINCQHGDVSNDNAQVSVVSTISPRTINEARFGFTDQLNFFTPFSINEGFPAKLGWNFAKADVFPDIQVNGSCCFELQPQSNAVYKEFVFDPSDVITLTRGRHVLHFGGEFLITRADSTAWGNENAGQMQFSGVYTASTQGTASSTGVPYADFLLGYANGWNANVTPEFGGRMKSPQLFVQDDFKVRPNLTVNLGLRWQGMTGWTEVKGNMKSFDPSVANPANNTNGAMWYGVTHANGRNRLEAPVWSTFLPRAGFSYGFRPDSVIRGGIGLYAYTWSLDTYGPGMGGAFGSSGSVSDNTNGIDPVVLLSSDGNTNYQGAAGKSINSAFQKAPLGADAYNGQGVSYQAYHTPVPKILQWNLSLQQQFGHNMVAEIAYVASHGYNLLFPVDINQVPENKLAANDASGATNARPYPLFQGIGGGGSGGTNNAVSNYNSLQVSLTKRLSSGLQFNTNYTWSHMLDTIDSSGWGSSSGTQGYQNSYSPGANYGSSNFDIRNSFKESALYDLPFGRNRRFLNSNTLLDEVIGGWQLAPTLIWSSGQPFTPVMQTNQSFSQAGDQYPNLVGNPTLQQAGVNEWFNVNAFASPGAGAFGDLHRNSLYGPHYLLANLALGKTFHVWERVNFELRGEANNFINHPSFGLPDTNIGPGHTAQITSVSVGGRTMQLYGRISF